MISLLLCRNCLSIITDSNNIKYFSNNNETLALKTMVSTIYFEDIPINSLKIYDKYCVYFIINCADCKIPIGKKYLTFNQYLLNNMIEFAINTTNIITKPFKFEEFVKEKNNKNTFLKNESKNFENLRFQQVEVVDFSQCFLILTDFLDSAYALHKNRMKIILKRIKKLEALINQIVNFLSKLQIIPT